MPAQLILAVFTAMVNGVGLRVEPPASAQKQAALPAGQAMSEALATWVEFGLHCLVAVSQVPLPPTDPVPFGSQYDTVAPALVAKRADKRQRLTVMNLSDLGAGFFIVVG